MTASPKDRPAMKRRKHSSPRPALALADDVSAAPTPEWQRHHDADQPEGAGIRSTWRLHRRVYQLHAARRIDDADLWSCQAFERIHVRWKYGAATGDGSRWIYTGRERDWGGWSRIDGILHACQKADDLRAVVGGRAYDTLERVAVEDVRWDLLARALGYSTGGRGVEAAKREAVAAIKALTLWFGLAKVAA